MRKAFLTLFRESLNKVKIFRQNCTTFFLSNQKASKISIIWNSLTERGTYMKKLKNLKTEKRSPSKMKARTFLILTLMISVAICQPIYQDETEREQEHPVHHALGLGVIIGIVLGAVFVVSLVCMFVSICCLPCCRVGRRC